jgi:tetratricopeptide (TPR) repeat protein
MAKSVRAGKGRSSAARPAPKPSRRSSRTETSGSAEAIPAVPAAQPAAPAISYSPPAPVVSAPAPDPEAVRLFSSGAAAMQRKAYAEAADAFRSLLTRFPSEGHVADRARVYLDLCQRELANRPATFASVEEKVTAATAALNNGDMATTERLAREVLAERPQHDMALYLLAAVHSRRGALDEAMELLTKAVSITPEIRAQMKYDDDFDALHDLEAFHALAETPPLSDRRQGLRPRR